jgi:hypothetical protein
MAVDIQLDGGGTLPRRHATAVLSVDRINGTAVAQVASPTGSLHWVAVSDLEIVG